MKPRILAIDTPFDDLRQEMFHTMARLRAFPFLVVQVALLELLLSEWFDLQQQDFALEREQAEAEARILVIDEALNRLCMAISSTLLAITGNDRQAPLYQRYFGAAPPSKLSRPVLGEQLAVMRTWVPSLTGEESAPALRAYGDQLGALVGQADQAVTAKAEAGRKRADFDLGSRKAYVDRVNAHRQALYGQLAEMVHGRPELGLAADFVTPFFLRDTRNRQLTLSELEQVILRMRERLQRHEAELTRRLEEQELAAQQRMAQELASAEAELAARVAALREQQKSR